GVSKFPSRLRINSNPSKYCPATPCPFLCAFKGRTGIAVGPSGFEPESSGPEPPRIDQATPRTQRESANRWSGYKRMRIKMKGTAATESRDWVGPRFRIPMVTGPRVTARYNPECSGQDAPGTPNRRGRTLAPRGRTASHGGPKGSDIGGTDSFGVPAVRDRCRPRDRGRSRPSLIRLWFACCRPP